MRRSYPLTAVEEVEYKESESPLVFRLVFSTYILILQAETQSEAKDWVDKITKGLCDDWVIYDDLNLKGSINNKQCMSKIDVCTLILVSIMYEVFTISETNNESFMHT